MAKTEYRISFCMSKEAVSKTVHDWLRANGFTYMEADGQEFFRAGDIMTGYRFFEYSLSDNTLIIWAYVNSPPPALVKLAKRWGLRKKIGI